jgi:hypothetical protein
MSSARNVKKVESSRRVGKARSGYNKGTIRGDLRYLAVSKDVRRHRLISIDYIITLPVTAEVASSSLVVPAILSKALAMVLTKPSRTQKGTFQCPFLCPFSVRALLAMSISSRCKVASRGSRCFKYGLNAWSLLGGADRGPYSGANPAACMTCESSCGPSQSTC